MSILPQRGRNGQRWVLASVYLRALEASPRQVLDTDRRPSFARCRTAFLSEPDKSYEPKSAKFRPSTGVQYSQEPHILAVTRVFLFWKLPELHPNMMQNEAGSRLVPSELQASRR